MNIDEKLKAIRDWSYSFEIREELGGRLYGMIMPASFMSYHKYTDAHVYFEDMVNDAYDIVVECIKDLVTNLERDRLPGRY